MLYPIGRDSLDRYNAVEMSPSRSSQGLYSEAEAAGMLGITVEELRLLLRTHILHGDDGTVNLHAVTFRPADMLALRVLTERGALSTTVH